MIDSNGFDTNYICKFSMQAGSQVSPEWVCVVTPHCNVECEGKHQDRFCCPYWSQIYHVNKVIE